MEKCQASSKNEFEVQLKEITQRTEDKIKALTEELREKSDKLFEASNAARRSEEACKLLEDSSDQKERRLKAEILDLQAALESYRNNDTVERNRLLMDNMNEKREIQSTLEEEKERARMLEIQLREANDHLKHHKASFERDQAIHGQKIQFQDIELKELRAKYNDLQTTHQNALLSCESASREKMVELQNSLMFDLKSSHERQLKEVEAEWESKVRFSKN